MYNRVSNYKNLGEVHVTIAPIRDAHFRKRVGVLTDYNTKNLRVSVVVTTLRCWCNQAHKPSQTRVSYLVDIYIIPDYWFPMIGKFTINGGFPNNRVMHATYTSKSTNSFCFIVAILQNDIYKHVVDIHLHDCGFSILSEKMQQMSYLFAYKFANHTLKAMSLGESLISFNTLGLILPKLNNQSKTCWCLCWWVHKTAESSSVWVSIPRLYNHCATWIGLGR